MSHSRVSLVFGVVLLAAVSCNRAETDWRKANEANSLAGYESFLSQHPESPQAAEAKSRVEALKLRQEFDWAISGGRVEALEKLIAAHPDDASVPRAKARLEDLWFENAAAANTVASLSTYLAAHPSGAHAAEARARLDAIYKEWMPPFRNAKSIRVEIAESYGEAKKTKLPFQRIADQVLPSIGLRVVPKGDADVVLSIRAGGEPWGGNYGMFGIGGSWYYTGCSFSGTMTLRAGEARVSESFGHDIETPYSFSTSMGGGPDDPDDAPFEEAFNECVPGAMRRLVLKAFGPAPLFAILGSDADETSTAKLLGRLQPPPVQRLLVIMKDDPRPNARRMAVLALGETKSPDAIGPLLQAVRANEAIKADATDALVRIGTPAVPLLLAALGDATPAVSMCAADALGRIRDARAVDPLIARLNSASDPIRSSAIAALGNLHHPRALTALKAAKAGGRQVPEIESAIAAATTQEE